MAALKGDRKAYFTRKRHRQSLHKTRRSQRWKRKRRVKRHRPRTATTRRKSPRLRPRRNVCIIKFPRRSYQMSCPLMTWCCDRWTRRNALLCRKSKQTAWSLRGGSPRRQKTRPQARAGRQRRDFLRAALREVARKKGAKKGLAAPKKRRRYSDDEVFYRLANSKDAEDGGSITGDKVPVSVRGAQEASS